MSGENEKKQRTPWDATKVADELRGAAEKIERIGRLATVTFEQRLDLRDIQRTIEDLEKTYRLGQGLRSGEIQDGADGSAD